MAPSALAMGRFWPSAIVLLMLFTPKLVLPGGVPLRLDDVLAFGAFGVVVTMGMLKLDPGRIHPLEWVLLATAAYTLLDTVLGSPVGGSIGPKEYLDTMRPLKFLAVFHVTRRLTEPREATMAFVHVLAMAAVAGAVLAMGQQFLLTPGSGGPLASFSLWFNEVEEQSRSYFGYRAFATFGTPTDFAYVSTVILFGSVLARGFPARALVAAAAALAVVLSGTRTFLFAGPLILLGATALAGESITGRVRNFLLGAVIVALASWAALELLSVDAQTAIVRSVQSLMSGDLEADDSLRLRLLNLVLAQQTWDLSPWRGVVTRDFMRPDLVGGVDSEYLLMFHRYGLIGIALLLLLSVQLWSVARSARLAQPSIARWLNATVVIGLLYGVTQGALINTRIGIFPFLLAGLTVGNSQRTSPPRRLS